jgi:hypothetical protein
MQAAYHTSYRPDGIKKPDMQVGRLTNGLNLCTSLEHDRDVWRNWSFVTGIGIPAKPVAKQAKQVKELTLPGKVEEALHEHME